MDLNTISQRILRLLPALVVGAAAGFFVWYPISDGDIFWHLTAGREILRTLSVPHADPFAFTAQAWQWIDLHWLYQVCMQGVAQAAGLWGVLAVNSVLFGAAASILFSVAAGPGRAWVSVPLWIAALFEVRYLAPHRPIVFSLLLFSLFIQCLEKFSRTGKVRFLLILLPLQIVWVNCQPLFVLGPVMYVAWFAGEWVDSRLNLLTRTGKIAWRPIIAIGISLLIAGLVNPYGIKAYGLAATLFQRIAPGQAGLFSVNIPENAPLLRMIGTPEARYVYATGIITAFALLFAVMRARSLRWSFVVIALTMLFLSFCAQRNIVLYFFAALPLISSLLPGPIRQAKGVRSNAVTVIMVIPLFFFTVAAVVTHGSMLASIRSAGPVAPFSFPIGSAAYLQRHALKGNLFNADRYGGYFLWKLYPEKKVFIDTRYAIRPQSFLAEYLAILDDPTLFEKVRERFGITAVAVPVARYSRYSTLSRTLWSDPDWRLVWCDGAEALFVLNSIAASAPLRLDSPEVVDSVAAAIRNRWAGSLLLEKEGLGYLASFLTQLGLHEGAERVWRRSGTSTD
jgi:hypothetical protein